MDAKEPVVEEIDPLVLDVPHLRQFTAGGAHLEREIATLFEASCNTCLAAMQPSTPDRAWQEAAHTLKGSARGVGARRVAALAEQAEALVGPRDTEAARETLRRELEQASAEAVAAFHRLTGAVSP